MKSRPPFGGALRSTSQRPASATGSRMNAGPEGRSNANAGFQLTSAPVGHSPRGRASYADETTFEKSGGERQRVPRAYLDANLVSGIRKQDLGAKQQALRR